MANATTYASKSTDLGAPVSYFAQLTGLTEYPFNFSDTLESTLSTNKEGCDLSMENITSALIDNDLFSNNWCSTMQIDNPSLVFKVHENQI